MLRHELYPGLLVMHQGMVSKVCKVNPKNTVIEHPDGARWNVHPTHLVTAPPLSVFAPTAPTIAIGDTVRFKRPRNADESRVFVVIKKAAGDTLHVTGLNDHKNTFFRNVAPSTIELASLEVSA